MNTVGRWQRHWLSRSPDKRTWLYSLLKIAGSSLVAEDPPRFPKWILYTFRDNHTETDQLTEAQKRQLLGSEPLCLVSTALHKKPIFRLLPGLNLGPYASPYGLPEL